MYPFALSIYCFHFPFHQIPFICFQSAGALSNQKEEKDPVTTPALWPFVENRPFAENPYTTPIYLEEDAVSVGDADQNGERIRRIQHRLVRNPIQFTVNMSDSQSQLTIQCVSVSFKGNPIYTQCQSYWH